jgi:aspartyl-tRNA(Asn)/glutamyl-tRNA(Gln) amidotransferase subunit B
LSPEQARELTAEKAVAAKFEEGLLQIKTQVEGVDLLKYVKKLADFMLNEEGSRLKAYGIETAQSPISASGNVVAVIQFVNQTTSSKQIKLIYDTAFQNGEDFSAAYEREKPQQITDTSAIEKMIDDVIAANPKQVEQYRAGKRTLAGFFVGQVMRASKGQANPALLNELVAKRLDG